MTKKNDFTDETGEGIDRDGAAPRPKPKSSDRKKAANRTNAWPPGRAPTGLPHPVEPSGSPAQ